MPRETCANLLNILEPILRSQFLKEMKMISFPAGKKIFDQDDLSTNLYVVHSGQVKITRVTPDGKEMILCMLGTKGCFCPLSLLDGGSQLGLAVAVTDVTLSYMNAVEFHRFYHLNPQFADKIIQMCLSDMRGLIRRLELLTFENMEKRLATILVEKHTLMQIDRKMVKAIRITQQELAQIIGVSRESVSHRMAIWEKQGLLTLKRGQVIINHLDKIQQIAAQ